MPLRKQGTIIPCTALVLAIGAAALPASAAAWSWGGTTTTTTSSTSTTTTAPTTTTTAVTDAAVSTTPTSGCTPIATTQAFAKYNDTAEYYPAPGGTFESGTAAWTLSSGARIVSGNERLGVAGGYRALDLPPGATATSPAFCVDESQPSFRFAAKLSSLDGGYVAIVIYRDTEGTVTKAQFTSSSAGTYFNGNTAWNPSAISPLATQIPLVNGGRTASVQLMFVGTTKSYGEWVGSKATIDSVMVDPYRRG